MKLVGVDADALIILIRRCGYISPRHTEGPAVGLLRSVTDITLGIHSSYIYDLLLSGRDDASDYEFSQ